MPKAAQLTAEDYDWMAHSRTFDIDGCLANLTHWNPLMRIHAARSLSRLPASTLQAHGAVTVLRLACLDEDPDVRSAAMHALRDVPDDETGQPADDAAATGITEAPESPEPPEGGEGRRLSLTRIGEFAGMLGAGTPVHGIADSSLPRILAQAIDPFDEANQALSQEWQALLARSAESINAALPYGAAVAGVIAVTAVIVALRRVGRKPGEEEATKVSESPAGVDRRASLTAGTIPSETASPDLVIGVPSENSSLNREELAAALAREYRGLKVQVVTLNQGTANEGQVGQLVQKLGARQGIVLDTNDTGVAAVLEKVSPVIAPLHNAAMGDMVRKASPVLASIVADPASAEDFSREELELAMMLLLPMLATIAPADWSRIGRRNVNAVPNESRARREYRSTIRTRYDDYAAALNFGEDGAASPIEQALRSGDRQRIATFWPEILVRLAFLSQATRDTSVAGMIRVIHSYLASGQADAVTQATPSLSTVLAQAQRSARSANWLLQTTRPGVKATVTSATILENDPFMAVKIAQTFRKGAANLLVSVDDRITAENVNVYLQGLADAVRTLPEGQTIDLKEVYDPSNVILREDLEAKAVELGAELSSETIIEVTNAVVLERVSQRGLAIDKEDIIYIGGEEVLVRDIKGVILGILRGDAAAAQLAIDLLAQDGHVPPGITMERFKALRLQAKARYETHAQAVEEYQAYVAQVKTKL